MQVGCFRGCLNYDVLIFKQLKSAFGNTTTCRAVTTHVFALSHNTLSQNTLSHNMLSHKTRCRDNKSWENPPRQLHNFTQHAVGLRQLHTTRHCTNAVSRNSLLRCHTTRRPADTPLPGQLNDESCWFVLADGVLSDKYNFTQHIDVY